MVNHLLFRKTSIAVIMLCMVMYGKIEAAALDQEAIHGDYNDGDFAKVVADIKSFMKNNSEYSRSDSLFIAKHLAVVYSASPETRELGKYYMHLLLRLMPSAELLDMYVSEEIDRIFEKIRKEFLVRQEGFDVDSTRYLVPKAESGETKTQSEEASAQPVKTSSAPAGQDQKPAETPPAKKPSNKKSNTKKYWIGGGVAVAVLGLTAVFLLSGGEEEQSPVYNVPKN